MSSIEPNEAMTRFFSMIKTKQGVSVENTSWANSKASQKKLSKIFDEDLMTVGLGRRVQYWLEDFDLGGGYNFAPVGEIQDAEAPLVDRLEDWNTELRKGSGYWFTEGGFEGSEDPDHASFVTDSFRRYAELGIERWFVQHWQRPNTMLSCGLTVEQAVKKVADLPYQKALTVEVLGLQEVAAKEVVDWFVRSLPPFKRTGLAKALACDDEQEALVARIRTGKKLPAKKLLTLLDASAAVPRTVQGIKDYVGLTAEEPRVAVRIRTRRSVEGVYATLRTAVDALAQAPGGQALADAIDPGMRFGYAQTGFTPLTEDLDPDMKLGVGTSEGMLLIPEGLVPSGCTMGASWPAIAGH